MHAPSPFEGMIVKLVGPPPRSIFSRMQPLASGAARCGRPDALLPYLVLREHVIDRLYHQNVGYWQANLEDLDHLGDSDRAELLVDYLGLSEKQLVAAAGKMAADGKYELAGSLLEAASARFGRTESIAKAERLVYLKLMEKYQTTDPFKFILYSAKIAEQTPPMANGK